MNMAEIDAEHNLFPQLFQTVAVQLKQNYYTIIYTFLEADEF